MTRPPITPRWPLGRGLGRAAVHELAHQIVGSRGLVENTDETAYECETSDRFAQYYSELRWTTARGALERRIGPRPARSGNTHLASVE